jgi:hypothetical protein
MLHSDVCYNMGMENRVLQLAVRLSQRRCSQFVHYRRKAIMGMLVIVCGATFKQLFCNPQL